MRKRVHSEPDSYYTGSNKKFIHSNGARKEWKTAFAIATGMGHKESNQPCQDYASTFERNGICVACLADGAGSCEQSHHGAKAIVIGIGEFLLTATRDLLDSNIEMQKVRLGEVISEILDKTTSRIGCASRELSSTLLAIAVTDDDYIAIHIGDGVIGIVERDRLEILSEPWNGEYSNITAFTTSPNIEDNLRIKSGSIEDVSGFILMSDGAAESLHVHGANKLTPAVVKLMIYCAKHQKDANEQLERVLDLQLTQRTMDDCSVAILARNAEQLEECLAHMSDDWTPSSSEFGQGMKIVDAQSTERDSQQVVDNDFIGGITSGDPVSQSEVNSESTHRRRGDYPDATLEEYISYADGSSDEFVMRSAPDWNKGRLVHFVQRGRQSKSHGWQQETQPREKNDSKAIGHKVELDASRKPTVASSEEGLSHGDNITPRIDSVQQMEGGAQNRNDARMGYVSASPFKRLINMLFNKAKSEEENGD